MFLIKVFNRKLGKKFCNIQNFPSLTLYRGGIPLNIPENPLNVDAVLNFLLKGSKPIEDEDNSVEEEDDLDDDVENQVTQEHKDEEEKTLSLPDQESTNYIFNIINLHLTTFTD